MTLRHLIPVAAGILVALTAVSCGQDPKEVTCSEFAAMSYEDQNDTLDDLLSAHDLETLSTANTIGVRREVDSYCGTFGFSKDTGGTAGRNGSQSIDNAVDWESGTWG
ncbi:hypothetical protein [Nocardia sp. AG03]|uniref:hypothetical protein n=1 Tax=Nocardia sp. AG03 TaxID=3025312 RepID=UPI0024185DAC|nr:hypothetical protein [Nocardia sp. AG03]